MNLKLKIWRQDDQSNSGQFRDYEISKVSPDSSFLEMLDLLNEQLLQKGEEPVAFDSDCREGVCGMCSLTINGVPHGGDRGTTTCQLHMRKFNDGDTITIEPFRAKAFPVLRDLVVDRGAFDKIIQAGGFITCRTGSAPDANEIPIPSQSLTVHLILLLVLVAELVLQPAKTLLQCYSPVLKFPTLMGYPKVRLRKTVAPLPW